MSNTSEVNCETHEPIRHGEKTIGGAEDESDGVPERSGAEQDGSETEFISNETAEYGEGQTGIKISYVLKEKEIYECLRQAGTVKTGGRTFVFVNIALIVLSAVLLIAGIVTGKNMYYFYTAIGATMFIVFGFFPIRINHIRAKSSADGHKILMKIYPEYIQMGHEPKKWKIPLDGTVDSVKIDEMIAIFIKEKDDPKGKQGQKMVILPLRCVDPVVIPEVQAIIFAGTKHRKISRHI